MSRSLNFRISGIRHFLPLLFRRKISVASPPVGRGHR